MVEKALDVEVKANLQPPSGTREINSRCPRDYRLSIKKDKDNVNQEHRDEIPNQDKDKVKSHNSSSANSQPQTQASKKHYRSRQEGHLTIGVNATEVAKKDKAKDLSHIECYTCKQKGHYVNKCPKKPKN